MLARKFANDRLHMAGIIQNEQKCLIFIVVPQGRKEFWIKMEKKLTLKNK